MHLDAQIRAMDHGDHVCLLYSTAAEQMAAVVPFVEQGLEKGERCVYLCDDSSAAEVAGALRAAGVDVDGAVRDGSLQLLTGREAYLAEGRFCPERMTALLRELETGALEAGHTGLRVSGEMTWALGGAVGCERLMEYESRANDLFAGSHTVALCQYDRSRLPPESLEQVLQTHPIVVLGERAIRNVYYEPPDVFLDQGCASARVEWKLAQLLRSNAAGALLAAQRRSLELVVTGAPLKEVLTHLVQTVEEQAGGGVVASVLVLDDEGRLRNGASPSLPDHYLRAIDGLPANPAVGTCCAAAATGQVVVTPDFATSPGWEGLSHLPLGLGLRGAWSMPILARDGRVLGTFGTYFRECRHPSAEEQQVVEVLARTASIAIERVQAEEALRDREEFNRRLLESSADCINVLSLDGRLLAMNRAGMQLLELQRDPAGDEWVAYWSGEDAVAAREAIAIARAGGEGRFTGYCATSTGEPRWWDVLVTPIPDATGQPFRLLGVARDVTPRILAEAELLRARDDAEAASHAKGQFLAIMSHELRTPLTGIIGYADLMACDIWGPTTDQQRAQLGRIKSAAWHLVAIIDEILTFSRVEAGKEEVRIESVDLKAVVRESADLLEPQVAEKGIQLRVTVPAGDVVVRTDAGKLRQILLNLAGNAVKFTDAGFVELAVRRSGDVVEVLVRDTGPGVPDSSRERIFQPFVQADQSNTRVKGGTGLGLTVCRTLARLLGGEVELVETGPGGTLFALRLPAAPEQRAPAVLAIA